MSQPVHELQKREQESLYRREDPDRAASCRKMARVSRSAVVGLLAVIAVYFVVLWFGLIPGGAHGTHLEGVQAEAPLEAAPPYLPPLWAVLPFAALLLSIAVLPLIPATEHWWHSNRNRFIVAVGLGAVALLYYGLIHPGGIANHFTHHEISAPGWETLFAAFSNGIFSEFVPFIVLLFSLYVISGGINLSGDLRAHPGTNCAFLGIGALLASFIGTTGAAMVLIRPLLTTNQERKHQVHTVIFFIFMVCNCGGLLLPIGDPPLFLGYLRGVPFMWTLALWPYWLGVNVALLAIYYLWDRRAYAKEELGDVIRDESQVRPLRLSGTPNLLILLGVVLCVALIVPDEPFLFTSFRPPAFFREAMMLALVVGSLLTTRASVRVENRFDYAAIIEVAALFSGIFICMQVPIEILNVLGPTLGIDSTHKFFWTTGFLSSFLDNAPTYVVFFETATTIHPGGAVSVVLSEGRTVAEPFLVAISLAAVFMGANTYIGNGPNFMVKSIAEQAGIKMPSFFGYMIYSGLILMPVFAVVTFFL